MSFHFSSFSSVSMFLSYSPLHVQPFVNRLTRFPAPSTSSIVGQLLRYMVDLRLVKMIMTPVVTLHRLRKASLHNFCNFCLFWFYLRIKLFKQLIKSCLVTSTNILTFSVTCLWDLLWHLKLLFFNLLAISDCLVLMFVEILWYFRYFILSLYI